MTSTGSAIIPDNAKVWDNYSAALFQDTVTPIILIQYPEIVDDNGTILEEAWSEYVIGKVDLDGIANAHQWKISKTGMFLDVYGNPVNVSPVSMNILKFNNS